MNPAACDARRTYSFACITAKRVTAGIYLFRSLEHKVIVKLYLTLYRRSADCFI